MRFESKCSNHEYRELHIFKTNSVFLQTVNLKFEFQIDYLIFVPGGKRDEELILPINDSLSVTLSSEQVKSYLILNI